MKLFDNVRNRKLRVCTIVAIAGTAMWFICKLHLDTEVGFNDWVEFVIWIVGLYFAGNVGEHGMRALNGKNKNESTDEPGSVPIEDR